MKGRVPGWETRLYGYVEANRHRPFAYGTLDCALFAAGAVEAVTGAPLAAIPAYAGALEAARTLKRLGHRDVIDLAGAYLRPWQSVLMARRGDIAAAVTDNGPTLGVVLGSSIAAPGESGVIFWALHHATRAWRVGD